MFKNRVLASAFIGMAALIGSCSLASAATVNYSTLGTFTSDGLSAISNGGLTLTFAPIVGGVITSTPSFASLGQFQVTGSGTDSITDNFTLTVVQLVPPPGGSGSFGTASISGTVTATQSSVFVTFTSPFSVFIPGTSADITYTLINHSYGVVPPSTNNGITTIEANIAESDHAPVVPLPASALGGSALLGLVFLSKMRGRKNAI